MFEGSCTALITPFDKSGNVNYQVLKQLVDRQIVSGTKALVILGTTGEAATITPEERKKIISFVVTITASKIPIIVGTGSNSTKIAVSFAKEAKALGASACLVVTPYYNKCNQNGLYQHFKTIATESQIPIILYNVPSRTGVNLLPETVIKLSRIKNIVGIKEASGNLNQIKDIILNTKSDFALYSGNDELTLETILAGGKGVISVTGNCYPDLVDLECFFALNFDYKNARRISNILYPINKALFLDINPICVKKYLQLMGINVGNPRLPLTSPNAKVINKLKEIKKQYEN
ncbi:MAG: 4-hydroxy-tetrahydrodipicolinate synthase [Clostridia bacterium]|nr:4-hydroxy-tetrahydrodipicolinate synthase [Clostridia bacterium]